MAAEFTGRRVAAVVLLLIVLTAVLPPAAAYALAQWRISRAGETAAAAAGPLGARKAELRAAAGTHAVVTGSGCRLPMADQAGAGWLETPVSAGSALESSWPRDPWGRCYLLNARGVLSGAGGLLISAGPNGSIETPLGASAPEGDDIASIVN